jgi:hypothetical protein
VLVGFGCVLIDEVPELLSDAAVFARGKAAQSLMLRWAEAQRGHDRARARARGRTGARLGETVLLARPRSEPADPSEPPLRPNQECPIDVVETVYLSRLHKTRNRMFVGLSERELVVGRCTLEALHDWLFHRYQSSGRPLYDAQLALFVSDFGIQP